MNKLIVVCMLLLLLTSCKLSCDNEKETSIDLQKRILYDTKQYQALCNKQDSIINLLSKLIVLKDSMIIVTFQNGYRKGMLDGMQGFYDREGYRLNAYKKSISKN